MDTDRVVDPDRIRQFRDALRWSQVRLARESGVDQGTVSKIERGETRSPEYETVSRLARALGVSVGDLRPAEGVDAPSLVDAITNRVTERVVGELRAMLLPPREEDEMATILQRAGVPDPGTVDDRLPVLFSGVIWEELTDAEKAGVIALAKRLMGRPQGKMGRRET